MRSLLIASVILFLGGCAISSKPPHPAPQSYPQPVQGDYVIRDFHFTDGTTLPELRIHYRTLGQPHTDSKGIVRNAVLILHGTSGSGAQFTVPDFAGELFGKDQPLDAGEYFVILPDDIGHGQSSKPSDGMHAKFPAYGYRDMVETEYRLVSDCLHVNHLRLCMGTSMGGMHTWLWGELHPDFMDALMPLASLPAEISGRNRMWRKMIIDDIRTDPDWKNGEYSSPPHGLKLALEVMYFMSDNPRNRYEQAPTGAQADKLLEDYANEKSKTVDANDLLYALESSRDYNPASDLNKIHVPLLAINSADDLINPPELKILETNMKNVKHGQAIVIAESPQTRGHGTHTLAWIWKNYLKDLLRRTEH